MANTVSMENLALAQALGADDDRSQPPNSEIEHASVAEGAVSAAFEDWRRDFMKRFDVLMGKEVHASRHDVAREEAPPEPPAPPQVIDPDSVEVDPAGLRDAMTSLTAILPPMPQDATPLRRARHERLVRELEGIHRLAGCLAAMPPAQQGLALRDAYARASRSARQLARNLDGSRWRRWKREPALATAYAGVAALLGALKDRHRSAAAAHIARRDAQREAQRLSAAGWRQGHAGDALVNGSGVAVAHLGAPLAGGGARWQDWRFNDDDSKYWITPDAHRRAGAGASEGAPARHGQRIPR